MIQLEQQQHREFVGGLVGWLTPTTYIKLTGAGSTNSVQIHTFPSYYVDLYSADPLGQQNMKLKSTKSKMDKSVHQCVQLVPWVIYSPPCSGCTHQCVKLVHLVLSDPLCALCMRIILYLILVVCSQCSRAPSQTCTGSIIWKRGTNEHAHESLINTLWHLNKNY